MLSMRAAVVCLVGTVLLIPTLAAQVPLFNPAHHQQYNLDTNEWNLDKLPNPNMTDHLVFETVHSLLQHWPNTRMRNGHNIVPGIIPKGTLLYHGTVGGDKLPQGPEWVATDPEHSYLFCRGLPRSPPFSPKSQRGCWHLTLAATRPLKVVYFDGSSAAKIPFGSMDTQDLIAFGRIVDNIFLHEWQRIHDLCKWGKSYGVDGFVRMEMDFEVMLCDFTSGVEVVSFAHIVSRGHFLPGLAGDLFFEVINSGSWHNHLPGETRIQLDLTRLISFYDTQLAPSLVGIRAGQERWDHRVQNVSSEDLSAIKSRLEEILVKPQAVSSGIDWATLIQVIVDRYAGRLGLIRHLLNSSVTDPDELLHLTNMTQTQLRIMLRPYLLFTATPTDPSDKNDLDWAIPVYNMCATTHTYSMDSEMESMTDSEKLLLQAVRGTTREICRVVTKMWAAGVYTGIDPSLGTKASPDPVEITHLRGSWATDLDRLMTWLDWSVWVKCSPECDLEEMCYLPTWPVGFPLIWDSAHPQPPPPGSDEPYLEMMKVKTMAMKRLAEEMEHIVKPEPDDWIRPQPKCIRRVDPYDF